MTADKNTRAANSDTLPTSINPANVRKLMQVSRTTGHSLSAILNRAADLWLAAEAPVYLEHAKQGQ